jgi:hypothetical protein
VHEGTDNSLACLQRIAADDLGLTARWHPVAPPAR